MTDIHRFRHCGVDLEPIICIECAHDFALAGSRTGETMTPINPPEPTLDMIHAAAIIADNCFVDPENISNMTYDIAHLLATQAAEVRKPLEERNAFWKRYAKFSFKEVKRYHEILVTRGVGPLKAGVEALVRATKAESALSAAQTRIKQLEEERMRDLPDALDSDCSESRRIAKRCLEAESALSVAKETIGELEAQARSKTIEYDDKIQRLQGKRIFSLEASLSAAQEKIERMEKVVEAARKRKLFCECDVMCSYIKDENEALARYAESEKAAKEAGR